MLSRVAERMYWLGRYLERAENTARLVGVNANLLLDLPRAVRLVWRALIDITGAEAAFEQHYQNADERNVCKFLLADAFNPVSVMSSLAMARENGRTTREVIPTEIWEQVNDLYLYARDNAAKGTTRGGRHEFLNQVVSACQRIAGGLAGTMTHGPAYNFIRLGRNLERADMTTRIVDVGCANLLPNDDVVRDTAFENILWMSVLRSLSAYQMYRQHVHDRVNGEDVVAYLLQDLKFPRAVGHCLHEVSVCLQELPRNEAPLRSVTRLQRRVADADIAALLDGGLHQFIDEMQQELGDTHGHIAATWFLPVPAPVP